MALLSAILRGRQEIAAEREHHTSEGLLEGRFRGCLPKARLCEFQLEQTGEILELQLGPGMPNVNSLLGDKWFIRVEDGTVTEMRYSIEWQSIKEPGGWIADPGGGRWEKPRR